jgi:glycosyltransferase involved in cell wall biosynthesis
VGKDKQQLFVITIDYPFSSGEPFFHWELQYLAMHFDEVIVFNQLDRVPDHLPLFQLTHPNVKMVLAGSKFSLKKVWGIAWVLWQSAGTIFKDLKQRGLLTNWLAIKTAMMYQLRSFGLENQIKSFLKQEGRDAKNGIWYSYWAIESALTLAKFKKENSVLRTIVRAHNTDIYEERHPNHYLPFRNFIFKHIDVVVPISNHGKAYLSSKFGKLGADIQVSRLGIPLATPLAISQGVPLTLLSLSGISPVKNLEAIIQTLFHWQACEVEWHHIGEGNGAPYSEGVKNQMMELASNNPKVKVFLHGFVAPDEVLHVVRSIKPRVLVNTSHFEGIPVSMMEAASLGIPMIGPNVCGVPEIIIEEKNGFCIDMKDKDSLGVALLKLIQLPTQDYLEMCRTSCTIQQTYFNETTNFKEFIALLCGQEHL